jgi:Ca2+-binding RTX toxin-like protein
MRLLLLGVGAAILLGADHASANYTAALNGTTLEVTGDNRSDQLALRLDASGTMLEVDVKNDGMPDFTFDRTLFTNISVSAGGGDDLVLIDESAGAFTDKSIVIDGGAGDDTLIGGSGNDVIIGGNGDDFVDAKRGNDVVLLGAGDDVAVWHPGDGSDVVEGQQGNDTLDFRCANVSENIDISPNGDRVRLFRDVGNVTMDLNGVEQVDLSTLGGSDVVTVNDLTGTDLVRVNVDLEGTPDGGMGDGQADSIVLNGSASREVVSIGVAKGILEVGGLFATVRVEHGEPALDRVSYVVLGPDEVHVLGTKKADTIALSPVGGAVRASVDSFPTAVDVSGGGTLVVFGLGGADTISGASGLAALGTSLVIDGGSGDDVITGGDGADVLIGGRGNDIVRGGRGNDVLLLGSGSDTAVWQPGDGSDTIEGQQGNDTLDFRCANVSENIDISPNGDRVRLFRDVGNVTMDLNGVEQVSVSALGGSDQIVVNDLSGTDVKGVTVDLEAAAGSGSGDGQVDFVVVNGTPQADKMSLKADAGGVSLARKGGAVRIEHPEPMLDRLVVNGLGGVDRIQASPSVSSAITLTINPD